MTSREPGLIFFFQSTHYYTRPLETSENQVRVQKCEWEIWYCDNCVNAEMGDSKTKIRIVIIVLILKTKTSNSYNCDLISSWS